MNSRYNGPIVLFDSECLLCSRSIQLILDNERSEELSFAPLKGKVATSLNLSLSDDNTLPDSIFLYHEGRLYTESTAALMITKWMKTPYTLLQYLLWLPDFIRNPIYRIIAKNRYKWFGKNDGSCILPSSDLSNRFFD